MFSKKELSTLARENHLIFQCCGGCHYQIKGGLSIVNVYFKYNSISIYIQGTAKGKTVKYAQQVIDAALKIPSASKAVERSKSYKYFKKEKWKSLKGRKCHWCQKPFKSIEEATVDHVIALSNGGSNGDDNLVLACNDCNKKRGNQTTKKELETIRKKPNYNFHS